jgi:hypothetical protein
MPLLGLRAVPKPGLSGTYNIGIMLKFLAG